MSKGDDKQTAKLTLGQLANALTPPPLPPPTLEQEVRKLIAMYGAEAVKTEVRLATKKPVGRSNLDDWPFLAEETTQDARDWLAGRDPIQLRKNYSIAKRFAERNVGQSVPSTMLRIQRKLKDERELRMLYQAFRLSFTDYPFAEHIRVAEALSELFEKAAQKLKGNKSKRAAERSDVWRRIVEQNLETLARYREVNGEPPSTMTWAQIEAAPKHPANTLGRLIEVSKGGMFGAGPPKKP